MKYFIVFQDEEPKEPLPPGMEDDDEPLPPGMEDEGIVNIFLNNKELQTFEGVAIRHNVIYFLYIENGKTMQLFFWEIEFDVFAILLTLYT